MAKGNWKKHEDLKKSILLFIVKKENNTTNQIFEFIKNNNKFSSICWDTIKRQLDELYSNKKINKTSIGRMNLWNKL